MAKAHIKKVFENEDIIRSENDKRLHRGLELSNGMKVMLVSDKDTDKSAAAMDINIGAMKDPKEIPGLAHFCEHMLFLGTEKYPEENAYSKYLTEHGGSCNAYTSLEHTNYHFDVAPEALSGALDRFAQFFLCPLFTASATEREVNAINSENDGNLQNDSWRSFQLEKCQAKDGHDYSKFSTGNKDTLLTHPAGKGIDVREKLLQFHKQYYSSNIMGLAVVGKESLDELEEMVVPLFCGVEDKQVKVPEWLDPPYGPEQKQKMTKKVPVKDIRDLGITWSIPDLQPFYKANPGYYLSHLLGHEGPGSLLSELKAKGWVNTLFTEEYNGAKGFSFLNVSVDLTEEGQEHVEDIITLIYQYINMLQREGPQEWVFQECRDICAMLFRFKEKEQPWDCACNLSAMLTVYPVEEVLSASYLLHEYRPDLITMLLDLLTPDNMRVMVTSKKFEGHTDQTEKWYGTQYRVDDIPPDILEGWRTCGFHDKLRLPDRNEFIPSNFDLVPRETDNASFPQIVMETDLSRVWFKQDDNFLKPKAYFSFDFTSPYANIDPLHCNLTTLFEDLFEDALNEYAYAADLAGLGYSLCFSGYGIVLSISGYSDKLEILLKKVLHHLTNFTVDQQRFHIIKERYERELRNFYAEQPRELAVHYTTLLMSEVKWSTEELLSALEDVTVEKLQAFVPTLLSLLHIESLAYGNVTKQKAVEIATMVEDTLKEKYHTKLLVPRLRQKRREVQLPDGSYYMHKQPTTVHKSSCIELYYQCGLQNTQSNMLLELTAQAMEEQCFNILRTQEQLGYIVYCSLRQARGVQGLQVIVQSSRKPAYVEGRVEAFLRKMEGEIKDMVEETFQKHVSALATLRLEKPKKMAQQKNKYWDEIGCQQYNFDRDNIEVEYLRTLTRDDLYRFYKEYIALGAEKRHKMAVHIVSQVDDSSESLSESASQSDSTNRADENGLMPSPQLPEPEVVEDIAAFKQSLPLFPLARPFIDLKTAHCKL